MKAILSTEKEAYSVMLEKEANMIIELSRQAVDKEAEPTPFEIETKEFLCPLTPAEWAITDSEMEILLKSK
jgi:hypothetical protein